MKKILHIMRKEFIQLRRDPKLLPVILAAPILQLLLLGYAVNMDIKDIPTVVCDLDRTAGSRGFLAGYFNSGYFLVKARVSDIRAVDRFLDDGEASMAIVVPRGFGDKRVARNPAVVQIIVDGTESQSATIGANYAAMIATRYTQGIMVETFERLKSLGIRPVRINPEVRVWYNPELKSRYFMVPGVLGLILLVMTMMLTSMAIVREKETGTMEQLIVTPIRPLELIVGKLLPFLLIGLLDVTIVVSVVTLIFRVPVRGSLWLLFGLSLVFMLTTLGVGLFISTISRNQQQAMITAVFFLLPMMLLSGFVFPVENMPKLFQWLTYAIPLKYYFIIIRGIFLKGVGMGALWDETLILLGTGAVILIFSVLRFRKKVG